MAKIWILTIESGGGDNAFKSYAYTTKELAKAHLFNFAKKRWLKVEYFKQVTFHTPMDPPEGTTYATKTMPANVNKAIKLFFDEDEGDGLNYAYTLVSHKIVA